MLSNEDYFCYGVFLFVLVLYFSTHELSSQGAYQEISQFFVTHVIPGGLRLDNFCQYILLRWDHFLLVSVFAF